MIVDCAVYADGRRVDRDRDVDGVRVDAAARGGFAWVGLVEPTAQEFEAVRREFRLHELAVEDAVSAHQRPKLEISDGTIFLVVEPVRYDGHQEVIEVGEVMLFLGPDFLVTVRHGAMSSRRTRAARWPGSTSCGTRWWSSPARPRRRLRRAGWL